MMHSDGVYTLDFLSLNTKKEPPKKGALKWNTQAKRT